MEGYIYRLPFTRFRSLSCIAVPNGTIRFFDELIHIVSLTTPSQIILTITLIQPQFM